MEGSSGQHDTKSYPTIHPCHPILKDGTDWRPVKMTRCSLNCGHGPDVMNVIQDSYRFHVEADQGAQLQAQLILLRSFIITRTTAAAEQIEAAHSLQPDTYFLTLCHLDGATTLSVDDRRHGRHRDTS